MNLKLHTHVFTLLFLLFTTSGIAIPVANPVNLATDPAQIKQSGLNRENNSSFRLPDRWLFTKTSDTINSGSKGSLEKANGFFKKPSAFIFNLDANEGGGSSQGVSTDLRIIPNIGLQLNWKKFGIGFDAGTFKSSTEFNYDAYYKQFESFGFAVYENSPEKWKSTYFSLGPQYTLHLSTGKATSAAKAFSASGRTANAAKKELDITFSLKGGITINKSPDISIYDSTAPYKVIASYSAPDDYKKNVLNIKPGVAITYWFNNYFGANFNMQYMIVTGQNEFETGYRDVSNIDFTHNQKEIRYMVLNSPAVVTTTKGPGNIFSIGAGISVKFGLKDKTRDEVKTPQNNSPTPNSGNSDGLPPANSAVPLIETKAAENPATTKTVTPEQEKEKEKEKEYIRPTILSPADGASVTTAELQKSVILKWTAVIPTPVSGEVVYHVKLYEVPDGQQSAQVLKSSKPVFEKNIDNATVTSFSRSVNPGTTGKPSQFTWTVQATDRLGKPYGQNNGTSDASTFKVSENDIDIAIDTLKVECCKDGKQLIKFTIKNNLPNTNTILKKIIITAVNGNFGSPQPVNISALVSPPLPFSFLPSSASLSQGRMNFTASVDCNLNMNNLVVKAEAERSTPMGLVTDNDLESDTLNCICRECDKIKIEIPDKAQTSFNANSVVVNTPVNVSPKKVKKITADIVYFSYKPESEECAPCNKDSKTYGNFVTASLNAAGFPSNPLIPYGHEAIWNSNNNSGAMLNGQFSFNVSTPPLVKCCSAKIRFCIRYTFQFDDCTVCEKVVCYTINKEGCTK